MRRYFSAFICLFSIGGRESVPVNSFYNNIDVRKWVIKDNPNWSMETSEENDQFRLHPLLLCIVNHSRVIFVRFHDGSIL